jgi:EpsI family protein
MSARLFVLATTFAIAAALMGRATASEPVPIRTSFATFPTRLAGWTGTPGEPFEEDVLKVLGVDEYVNLVYTQPSQLPVGLYIGYYKSQREGDTMHSPLNCLPGAGWAPESKSYVTVDLPASTESTLPPKITINRYLIRKGTDRMLVLYWYQSHGRFIASEYTSKVMMVLDAIRTNRTDAALIRVITPVLDNDLDGSVAEGLAVEFVQGLVPVLPNYLPS